MMHAQMICILRHPQLKLSDCEYSRGVDRALDALALEVVWLSARRARDYMRAYVALAGENEGGATALQKQQEVEEQKVEQKKHRDALDFGLKWVQSLLHLCTRPEEKGGPRL
jgi:hypothetical protein